MGGWWRWALVSPDGVAPSRMVGVSASVNLPMHHKVQKFSSGNGSPGWSQKNGRKTAVVVVVNTSIFCYDDLLLSDTQYFTSVHLMKLDRKWPLFILIMTADYWTDDSNCYNLYIFVQQCQSVQPPLHSSWQRVTIFHNGPSHFPLKLPLSMKGFGPPSNTWFLGSTGVLNPNGILISLALFLQGSILWQTDGLGL